MCGAEWPSGKKIFKPVEWKCINGYNVLNERRNNMSSMILCIKNGEAIIASDSRMILNKKIPIDCMPKVLPYKNGLIGIVGLSYYNNKLFGENLEGDTVLEAAENLATEIKGYPIITEIMAVEYDNGIQCTYFCTGNNSDSRFMRQSGWYISGVKHSVDFDKLKSDYADPNVCRALIKADEECEKILKKIPAVGGPIQIYKVSIRGIENLSDKDAPTDFKKVRELIEKEENNK